MIFIIAFLLSSILGFTAAATDVAIFRRDLNFSELVPYDGYSLETHYVTTEDGYTITLFRIKASNCSENSTQEPIMFMHGLFLSGDDCIVPGPNRSHCYIYASAGHDVWVPNSRGTLYSRNHTSLDPDKDSDYWDFSFEEMAKYDMPACIDYILKTTGKEQIVFVGHAQGVTLLLLLCAEQPEYNAKVKVGFGMSSTAWLDNCRFVIIQLDGLLSNALTIPIEAGINMEVVPRGGVYQPWLKATCGTYDSSYTTCSALYYSILGDNQHQIPNDTLKVMTGHMPSGTALKNFNHWGQIQQNGFRRYDHGALKNLLIYQNTSPPEFDLSNVTMNWVFIGSENDYVSSPIDLDTLIGKLPNAATTKCILSDTSFGHLDYQFGKDVPNLITPSILKYIDTGVFECL